LAAAAIAQAPNSSAPEVSVLWPNPSTLVLDAGPDGPFVVSGSANGASVRFLVDTGATLVVLTPRDARAAGIDPSALVYDKAMRTANGTVPAAMTVLREIRVGGISIGDVRAAIIAKAPQSVLGMSFLSRLKSFKMRQVVDAVVVAGSRTA
jgi:aspartyl protease family protein